MNALLEAIAGPLKGTVFPLQSGEISIGREPSNEIAVLDGSVSRRHCVIAQNGDRFTVADLGSRNRTYVNGVAVDKHTLESGDELRVGTSLFRFVVSSEQSTTRPELPTASEVSSPTVVLRREDAVYLRAADSSGQLPPTMRTMRDLNALFRISRAIGSVRALDPLQRQILESVLEVIPAERGAILLFEPGSSEVNSSYIWDRWGGFKRSAQVSQTITRRVLDEGVALLSNEIPQEDDFSVAASVVSRNIQSVLAVPLEIFDRTLGIIYLDTSSPSVRFDAGHLELLTAVASIASIALDNVQRLEWLQAENARLNEEINLEHNMVGDSPRMREVYQFISRVAPTDSTVLIWGESGTGKELVARAIHRNSTRASKPYVAINCAALTETLLESELFGHEKGAFTGAVVQKKGKLEVADGGTVFLDEIGELAPLLQAKLLRVLQEREFERVGGTKTLKLDVRLLAATNRDLEENVRKGQFRQDLFFRLNVVSIRMPALRDRRDDIPLLATHFMKKHAGRVKRTLHGISPEARARMVHYDWPGNVRELENAIERAVVLGSSNMILPEDLPESILEHAVPASGPVAAFHEAVVKVKKELITTACDKAGGNITEAAKLLGLHPNYLHRLIRNLELKSIVAKPTGASAGTTSQI